MKIKFSRIERVVGIFVMSSAGILLAVIVGVAIHHGWFERDISLETTFTHGDGLFPGMPVHMSGLVAGAVDAVGFDSENLVTVKFHVSQRFFERIKSDSVVSTTRPFVIGDKALDITLGSATASSVHENQRLQSASAVDIVDLFAGRSMTHLLSSVSDVLENASAVLESLGDGRRTKNLVAMIDQFGPALGELRTTLREVSSVSHDMSQDHRLRQALQSFQKVSDDLAIVTPQMVKVIQSNPDAGQNVAEMITKLSALTDAMTKVIPALAEVAPDLPHASRRAIEAMDEAVVTLKAMQKFWLISGKVEDVKAEEARRAREIKDRAPAQQRDVRP